MICLVAAGEQGNPSWWFLWLLLFLKMTQKRKICTDTRHDSNEFFFFFFPRELPSIVVTLWTHLEIFSIQWGVGCGISGNISRKFRKGLHPTFYWGSKKNGIYRLEQKWFWNVCGILRWSGHSVSPFSLFLFQVSILHSVVFCSLYTPF